MSECAELELSLWRGAGEGRHWLEARYQRPGEDRLARSAHGQVTLDIPRLDLLNNTRNDAAYGRALAEMLFKPQSILDAYTAARDAARSSLPPVPLRLRLRFETGDAPLHALRWETLCDPHTGSFLAADEHVLLSRILLPDRPADGPAAPPPRSELRALAVIADPADITESYGMDGRPLERVQVADVRAAIGARLAGVATTWLCTGGDGKPTLEELIARLREGYDALYLVCHGALEARGCGLPPAAKIWLEDEAGGTATVYVEDQTERNGRITPGLATRLGNLTRRPRLAVLASCQSGGRSHDGGALAGFGPRLVAAGVPAVVAMQDDVAMVTADTFAECFFRALLDPAHGGEIDAAVAAGRGHVASQEDWAAVALFMGLASGRLFDEAGARAPFMAGELKDFVARPVLLVQAAAALLEGAAPRATTMALHGSGGFGKTTLARAVCHLPAVRKAFDGGILWATLGETPDLRASLTELCAALAGERQNFSSAADAGRELARLLEGRRCLLVVDDVWNEADVRPFLQGGAECARLITTRSQSIAAGVARAAADRIPVEEMTGDEAYAMLTRWLAVEPADRAPLDTLAERAGRLPLLLELIAGGLRQRVEDGDSLAGALAYVNQALDEENVVAFDVRNARERDQAIDKSISASLRLLADEEKTRLLQTAIFPKDTAVPLTAVGQLWETPPFKTERQCKVFADLALVKFDLPAQTIRLHSVLRAYLSMHLADPAACHLRLLAAWGDPHRLPTPYAWRWYACHLAEAARLQQDLDLGRQLVDTVLDDPFQTGHLDARHDPVALVADAALAVATLAGAAELPSWPLEPAALPLVVRAARGQVVTRMQRLAPEHLFGKAEAGDVQGAEGYLGLFGVEREWQQACQLLIAWLAARRNEPEAKALFARACVDLPGYGALARLAGCVGAVLRRELWTEQWLPEAARGDVDAIIARMAGLKNALGMPTEVNLNLEEVRNIDPTASSYEASMRMTLSDSQFLVGYAVRHPNEPQGYLDDHLAILTGNSYRRYRNRFLWPLLDSVLCHPDEAWARGWAAKVAVAALSPSKLEFQEGAGIMALALLAKADPAASRPKLDVYSAAVGAIARTLEHGPRGDSWGSYTRRLAALALAYRLLDDPARSHDMIAQARKLHYGFAGFQSPAWLALAETMRVCGEPAQETAAVLEAARLSAVNVQDLVFCAQTTARWHALRRNWWDTALDRPGLVAAVDDLRQGRRGERFAALHEIGERYRGRGDETGDSEMPHWVRNARTLADLAALHGRPLPDPGLAPKIAARLAAEALALPGLAPAHRVQLIQALTPIGLFNPTALDTLLTRLLFAAEAAWGPGIAADVAGVFGDVAGFLRQRVEADLPAGATPPYEVRPGEYVGISSDGHFEVRQGG